MKTKLLFLVFLLNITELFAVKIKFTATNMSVNVAEGSIGVFTAFKLFPNDFENTDSLNTIDLVDFPSLSFNDIVSVSIEKAMLKQVLS